MSMNKAAHGLLLAIVVLGAGWFGIPTFFKLPVALTPEDLMAGDGRE